MTRDVPQLFTIGYERRSVGALVAALLAARVERVVDVRELPLSRRRGFSKTALAAALAEAGIAYVHVRGLGNPRPIRDRFRGGDVEGGMRAYREHLHAEASAALAELDASAATTTTCLLCVEAEHTRCHRSVVAGAVAERLPRVAVIHL